MIEAHKDVRGKVVYREEGQGESMGKDRRCDLLDQCQLHFPHMAAKSRWIDTRYLPKVAFVFRVPRLPNSHSTTPTGAHIRLLGLTSLCSIRRPYCINHSVLNYI